MVLGQDEGLPTVWGCWGCSPVCSAPLSTHPCLQAQALVQYLEEPLTQVAAS